MIDWSKPLRTKKSHYPAEYIWDNNELGFPKKVFIKIGKFTYPHYYNHYGMLCEERTNGEHLNLELENYEEKK